MRTRFRHDRAAPRTSRTAGFLLLVPAVVVACSEQPLPTSSTNPAGAPALSADAGNPVVLSASGSGHRNTPLAGVAPNVEEGWRTFSFTAEKRRDGTTTGHVQLNNRAVPSVLQHGRIFCINEVGDGIYLIAAEVTQRIAERPPNQFDGLPPAVLPDDYGMVSAVRDNGEGANASGPDQITAFLSTTLFFANLICTNPGAVGFTPPVLASFFNDVEAGNIQVRDKS